MNIDVAVTEAFSIYIKHHLDLNLSSKVTTGSVATIRRIVDVPNGDKLMGELIDTADMPWGTGKPFPNPTQILDKVIKNLAYNGVVQSFSGFEFYLTHLIADLAHFSPLKESTFKHAHTDSKYNPNDPPSFPRCCFAYAEQFAVNNALWTRISELKDKLGIKDKNLDALMPLFDYFRSMRNCIAHLEGMADKDFIEVADSAELKAGYIFWNKNYARGKAPALPVVERGTKININVTHTIFASAVNYEIGRIFNAKAVELLGIDGIVEMACYYALLVDKSDFRNDRKVGSADGAVSNFLSNKYFVKEVSSEKTIAALKKLNLWKQSIERYEVLAKKV
jgi:hypothetical protein